MKTLKKRKISIPSIQHHIFPNGLRVIYQKPRNNLPITCIHGFCDVGSIHEPDSIRGVAHFVEHMCFKGTKRITQPKDIFAVYDNVGAFLNAYTSKRYTEYIVKVNDEYVDNCMYMLSDMMMNSTFPKKEFVREEKVVIEENLRSRDNAKTNLNDMSDSLLYQGSSFSFPVDMIQYHRTPYDYKKIVDFYRHFYRPENMVISVVSELSLPRILQIIKESFFVKQLPKKYILSPLPNEQFTTHPKYAVQYSTVHQTKIQYLLMKKPGVNTIHMNISFRTCSQTMDDKYVLILLSNILGVGGMFGSRLPMLLREKHGLTYESKASTNYYEQAGDFTVYAQFDHTKVFHNHVGNNTKSKSKGVLPLLIEMFTDLVRRGVSQLELDTAKRNMQEKMKMDLEDSANLAECNGRDLLLYSDPTRIIAYDQYFEKHIKPITRKMVLSAIRKYFRKDRMVITMVSDHLPEQSRVEKECELFVGLDYPL